MLFYHRGYLAMLYCTLPHNMIYPIPWRNDIYEIGRFRLRRNYLFTSLCGHCIRWSVEWYKQSEAVLSNYLCYSSTGSYDYMGIQFRNVLFDINNILYCSIIYNYALFCTERYHISSVVIYIYTVLLSLTNSYIRQTLPAIRPNVMREYQPRTSQDKAIHQRHTANPYIDINFLVHVQSRLCCKSTIIINKHRISISTQIVNVMSVSRTCCK